MKLYLVQHGDSKPEAEDPQRGLSDKGIADAEKVAANLRPAGIAVQCMWHSGKARAKETAEILNTTIYAERGLVERTGIAPMDPVRPIADEIIHFRHDLMIVGHLPFLGKLVSFLLRGTDEVDTVAFQMGGMVCLDLDKQGKWLIEWMVVPDMLPFRK